MKTTSQFTAFSAFLATILALTIWQQNETKLSGFELNLKISDFQRAKKNRIELTRNDKKPLANDLPGVTKEQQTRKQAERTNH